VTKELGQKIQNWDGLGHLLPFITWDFFFSAVGYRAKNRFVDPYSFFPDPDPEFEAGDQSRALMTKN
jgi:hypothetical protein